MPETSQHKDGFGSRVAEIYNALKADYLESDHRLKTVASGIGTIAIQGVDRARASVIFVPIIAVDVFKDTHSPTEAALAAGAAFATWCAVVGSTTAEGLYQYPQTVEKFDQNFPGVTGFFEESLPGFENADKHQTTFRRLGSAALTRLKRGFTVSGLGPSPYVATAAAKGRSKLESHKLGLNASLDGGVAVGGVVFGLGQALLRLEQSNPSLAQEIQNDASNIKLWYAVAGGLILAQYAGSKLKKFRAGRASGVKSINRNKHEKS